MAVNFKPKQVQEAAAQLTAPKHVPKTLATTDEQIKVDEMIQIEDFFVEHQIKEMLERKEVLRKALQSIANEQPLTEDVVLVGTTGSVLFSKASSKMEVTDKEGLIAALTPEVFMQVAEVSTTVAKKYLSEIELDKFTTLKPGSRTFKGCVKNGGAS